MEPYAFGYEVGLAIKTDVSPNTPKVDEAKIENMPLKHKI
jgi:hypothetical protein